MKISQVCDETKLTKKAINYYEEKNIVNPKIDGNGYRNFNEDEVEKLKRVSLFRTLGLSVSEIKRVLDSNFPKEELRKCIIKKELENEVSEKQIQLLEKVLDEKDTQAINEEIVELNKKKSIKQKLLDNFPGFYGRFLMMHFSRYLEEPIKTRKQEEAYEAIVSFLDEVEPLEISDEFMDEFEEAMDFWTDGRILEAEEKKQGNIERPEQFLEENRDIIKEYRDLKESPEYEQSPYGRLMEAMKSFGKTSGYNDIFIPAMRRLSPSYEKYYKDLLEANEIFIEKFPDIK